MKKICNSCGKEFDEGAKMITHTAENGTEYAVCEECETNGIEIVETDTFCVCSTCGFVCEKDVFDGVCDFCGAKDGFGEIELTQAEEYDLDKEPLKVYEEKLGKDFADKISEWKKSEERKSLELKHKRDMHIDTIFVVGIVLAYFMIDSAIRNYIQDKLMFVGLMVPALLTLLAAPVFKKFDKKSKKKLPLWLILVAMAVFVDIYWMLIAFIK